ncbi:MAG TPA: response regulator [Anaerolineae bacterium]|nr:response regulator [Anaerolineae bacterium]HQI85898.1 response regulator [Anaerolineae bacterium]
MDARTSVLVVAKPGPLRDSLVALLKSLPQVATVEQTNTATSALRTIEVKRPALVVVDSNLPGGETWNMLNQVKARSPHTRCVVLSDTVQHYRQAEAAGASRVLLTGVPAPKLSLTLEGLLS